MSTYEEADRALEADVTEWLAKDPEHWPIFRLVIFDRGGQRSPIVGAAEPQVG